MLGHGRIATGLFPNQLRRQVVAGNLNHLTNPLPGGINPAWSHVTSRLTRCGFSRQAPAWMDDRDSFLTSEGSGSPKGLVGDSYTTGSFGLVHLYKSGEAEYFPSSAVLLCNAHQVFTSLLQVLYHCCRHAYCLFFNCSCMWIQRILFLRTYWFVLTAHELITVWLLMCRWVHIVGLLPLADEYAVSKRAQVCSLTEV